MFPATSICKVEMDNGREKKPCSSLLNDSLQWSTWPPTIRNKFFTGRCSTASSLLGSQQDDFGKQNPLTRKGVKTCNSVECTVWGATVKVCHEWQPPRPQLPYSSLMQRNTSQNKKSIRLCWAYLTLVLFISLVKYWEEGFPYSGTSGNWEQVKAFQFWVTLQKLVHLNTN